MKYLIPVLLILSTSCANKSLKKDYDHTVEEKMLPDGTWELSLHAGISCSKIKESQRDECYKKFRFYVLDRAEKVCNKTDIELYGCQDYKLDSGPNLGGKEHLVLSCYTKCSK